MGTGQLLLLQEISQDGIPVIAQFVGSSISVIFVILAVVAAHGFIAFVVRGLFFAVGARDTYRYSR